MPREMYRRRDAANALDSVLQRLYDGKYGKGWIDWGTVLAELQEQADANHEQGDADAGIAGMGWVAETWKALYGAATQVETERIEREGE